MYPGYPTPFQWHWGIHAEENGWEVMSFFCRAFSETVWNPLFYFAMSTNSPRLSRTARGGGHRWKEVVWLAIALHCGEYLTRSRCCEQLPHYNRDPWNNVRILFDLFPMFGAHHFNFNISADCFSYPSTSVAITGFNLDVIKDNLSVVE